MMQPKSPPTPIDKARAALTADPKRTFIMVGLGLIMAVLWARMFFNGPASATASFLKRSVAAITDSQEMLPKTSSSNPVLDWIAQPHKQVERNLFAIHLDYYAKAGPHNRSNDVPEDPAKLVGDDADQNRERQILSDNLQTQIGKLKLQTTMMGPTPTAVVNGELVRVGDTVAGFTVVKIQARQVAVEQDGITLEIGMP